MLIINSGIIVLSSIMFLTFMLLHWVNSLLGKWMCNMCTVKQVQNANGEVFIIDEDDIINIVTTASSSRTSNQNVSVSPAITTSGPPTMVHLQRMSQIRPGLIFQVLFQDLKTHNVSF